MTKQNHPLTTTLHVHPDINAISKQTLTIGVDEVGRGCLFGHMTVVACILPPPLATFLADHPWQDTPFAKLNDSKKLSQKQRIHLAQVIHTQASYAIVDVPASVIDDINIHQATLLGMKTAIIALLKSHPFAKCQILIDGKHAPLLDDAYLHQHIYTQTLIKGDSIHASIACASILAKVARDNSMMDYAKLYPDFGFDKHKGYPVPAHRQALANFGVLAEHRRSYAPVRQALLWHANKQQNDCSKITTPHTSQITDQTNTY